MYVAFNWDFMDRILIRVLLTCQMGYGSRTLQALNSFYSGEYFSLDESSFIPEVEYPDPSAIDPVCSPLSLSQLQFLTFPLVDRPPHRDTFSSSSECHATSPSTVNRA